MTLNKKKVDKIKLKKAMLAHVKETEAFMTEIMEGADIKETAKKYGRQFVNPLQSSSRK